MGGRRTACLSDAHTDPRENELEEILCQPASRRHQGPDRKRDGDNGGAITTLGQLSNGQTQKRIEYGKG